MARGARQQNFRIKASSYAEGRVWSSKDDKVKWWAIKPGSVVVFEGLDRAGKSTQLDWLASLSWRDPRPTFAHMPSGLTSLTTSIYGLTEREPISSPLARQLLHLACNAENMLELIGGRDRAGLILDRWWWSTMAYGWHVHGEALGIDAATFTGLIDAVWAGMAADVIFLFTTPFEQDSLNQDA